jgi:hypothetical protein
MQNQKLYTENEKQWIVAHEFILTHLRVFRKHGFWMTNRKSWDMIKWNALGPPMVSRKAVEVFFEEVLPNAQKLEKNNKASELTNGRELRGRCFVAEHMYPSKALKQLVLDWYGANGRRRRCGQKFTARRADASTF